jgi:hypothetical protein
MSLIIIDSESYDHEASRYHTPIYEKKRDELLEKIHDHFEKLFHLQLRLVSREAIALFESSLEVGICENQGVAFLYVRLA